MIKKLFFTALFLLFIGGVAKAQTTVEFEELSVPDVGYYNGSTDHSGTISSTEVFDYAESGANFNVTYTQEDGYGYWSGFAYSNQTDLTTADHTSYSAYSPTGGGADGSDNYIIAYLYGVGNMSFDVPVTPTSVQITNAVWAYKFMTGEDGSGHDYDVDDYFKLSIKGILAGGTYTEPIDFYLADFLDGNNTIIGDWTTVDLSSLGTVLGLEFQMEATDTWTPYYFCMDNLSFDNAVSVSETTLANFSIAPNPATNLIFLTNIDRATVQINDVLGKVVFEKKNCENQEQIDISSLKSGVYLVSVQNKNSSFTKKLLVE